MFSARTGDSKAAIAPKRSEPLLENHIVPVDFDYCSWIIVRLFVALGESRELT